VLEAGTTLGANNIVWSNTTICHDARIGNDNFFASNATLGGEITVGDRCFFGFSATVLHRINVGSDVLVASSALLTKNAPSLGEYIGIPAFRTGEIDPETGVCIQ
jgi:acetyltransferase-like isoleucine patch superfamily enzyme